MLILQQDNAPAHRAPETVEPLRRETSEFITRDTWPANSRDLNAVDDRIRGVMQKRLHRAPIRDVAE